MVEEKSDRQVKLRLQDCTENDIFTRVKEEGLFREDLTIVF